MPDTYSKSEGYRNFLRDAAVPSAPLCCFIIFIVLTSYSNITGIYGTFFTVIFFALFLFSSVLTALRYKKYFYNKKQFLLSIVIAIVIFCGVSLFLKNKISGLTSDGLLPENMENVSVIVDDISAKRYSSEIYFHSTLSSGRELKGIIYFQGENTFNKGDSLFLHKKIYKTAINGKNGFNSYLISRGIHYTAGLTENDITFLKKNNPPIRRYVQKNLLNRIDSLFKNPTAGVIKALLTGNQNYIDRKIIIQFRDSGVLHCLSASGLHVALFAGIPAFLLIPFFRRNIAMTVSLIAVLFYLYITDIPVSLLRAVIMFGLFYFQLILFRKRNVFNYLMLTCSIILLISPWEIFSPGFQLSFAATAGILIFYTQYRQSLNNLPGIISDTTAVTLSAQIVTMPIILFHMRQLNTAGLFSNIIIIPLITLIMGLAIFTILISFCSITAGIFSGTITDMIFKFCLFITDVIYDLKLNFNVYDLTPALIIMILISIIPLVRNRQFKRLKFYPVILSAVLCTIHLKQNYQYNESSCIITNGNSNAEIMIEDKKQVLKLNLEENSDTEIIISEIKTKNPDIKIIELANSSNSTLLASKKIMNDYIIDEYRFAGIPDINNMFKKIIFQLEKDNVIVKFNHRNTL